MDNLTQIGITLIIITYLLVITTCKDKKKNIQLETINFII
jgi:hypothetical protein